MAHEHTPFLEPEPGSGMLYRWRSAPSTHDRRVMYHCLIKLSTAQILALDTTPVLIAPAPGVNLVANPYRILLKLVAGSTRFQAGGIVYIYLGPVANNIKQQIATAAFVNGLTDRLLVISLNLFGTTNFDPTVLENLPLYIATVGAAFTNGNGSLNAFVSYEPFRVA